MRRSKTEPSRYVLRYLGGVRRTRAVNFAALARKSPEVPSLNLHSGEARREQIVKADTVTFSVDSLGQASGGKCYTVAVKFWSGRATSQAQRGLRSFAPLSNPQQPRVAIGMKLLIHGCKRIPIYGQLTTPPSGVLLVTAGSVFLDQASYRRHDLAIQWMAQFQTQNEPGSAPQYVLGNAGTVEINPIDAQRDA